MKQEIEVKFTLEVDCSQSKEQIKQYILDMEQNNTKLSSTYNRLLYSDIFDIQIKEEAEIYNNVE